jgi:hypothetical protein
MHGNRYFQQIRETFIVGSWSLEEEQHDAGPQDLAVSGLTQVAMGDRAGGPCRDFDWYWRNEWEGLGPEDHRGWSRGTVHGLSGLVQYNWEDDSAARIPYSNSVE